MSDPSCDVCPHRCLIKKNAIGLCGARGNLDGKITSLNYGMATALALDPIEKKPLARFHPGSMILSYGSFGCNLRCKFCQNSDISMARACGDIAQHAKSISPDQLVHEAIMLIPHGNIGVALTYNEPLIAPEYLRDVSSLLHEDDLCCVAVTNGYATKEAFRDIAPFIDAANIDLKCFTEDGYRKVGAPDGLDIVKTNIEYAVHAGIHVEVTTLIVPSLSDDEEAFRRECEWLSSVGQEIPLHLSRFFPQFKMIDANPTDVELMNRFQSIAKEHLKYVYLGNV